MKAQDLNPETWYVVGPDWVEVQSRDRSRVEVMLYGPAFYGTGVWHGTRPVDSTTLLYIKHGKGYRRFTYKACAELSTRWGDTCTCGEDR